MTLTLRKLTETEVKETSFGPAATTSIGTSEAVKELTEALASMVKGDSAVVELNGVTERAMKRRITEAAKVSGLRTVYASKENMTEFPNSVAFKLVAQRTHRTKKDAVAA